MRACFVCLYKTRKLHSYESRSATCDETPEIERDGEELPRLSPGVGCDSTAQGDKVNIDESVFCMGKGIST